MRRYLFYRLRKRSGSFTLIELLVVIAVILILAGLGLSAGEGVMSQAARSRTRAEIQAISAAMENYKADNGVYPAYDFAGGPSSYVSSDGSVANGPYQLSSEFLYEILAAKTNFTDVTPVGVKCYMSFRADQLGNYSAGAGSVYIQDAFGYSYGYNTGTATTDIPYNGTNLFDLWSTGGALYTTTNPTNSWISNWAQ
jgi:prepilin-type N-terminal cleavage/methylation domain-containing protein